MWRKVRNKLRDRSERHEDSPTPTQDELYIDRFASMEAHRAWLRTSEAERSRRREIERSLVLPAEEAPYEIRGRCYVCDRPSELSVDYMYSVDEIDGVAIPNWRERLICPHCGLNNRMRATVHLLETLLQPVPESRIYLTEQTTPLYHCFSRRFSNVVGSEFLGDACPLGAPGPNGWRNEDLTRLSFATGEFDALVCLDVFEHVPDFQAAFAECFRVLKPGGVLLVTVPFRVDRRANLVRARVGDDGEIEHLMEPEYHGDPLDAQGCLAFYHYGWELLDRFRDAGFSGAETYIYWSRHWGYLGQGQTFHVARKALSTTAKTIGFAPRSS